MKPLSGLFPHKLLLITVVIFSVVSWASDGTRNTPSSLPVDEPGASPPAVTRLQEALLEAMRSHGSRGEREAFLTPVVAAVFDLHNIARISLGPTWRQLEEPARAEFIARLQVLITATYAARFEANEGLSFQILAVDEASRGQVVRTRLLRPPEDPVSLDYFLRDGRIFDVVADGVSDLSLRRADYASIIQSRGYPALLEDLDASIAKLRSDDEI
jgi:phospholipid transport system substrate-binding protein